MCKLGDIIVVNNYIGEDNHKINRHSFIVIDDNKGYIKGLLYTHVATVISSFKNEKHRNKKLNYKENMEVLEFKKNKITKFKKSSYTKADKLFYFNKDKLDYYVLGRISDDLLTQLVKLIIELSEEDKVVQITENLK